MRHESQREQALAEVKAEYEKRISTLERDKDRLYELMKELVERPSQMRLVAQRDIQVGGRDVLDFRERGD